MALEHQVRETVDAIVKAIRPVSVVLFGSTAKQGKGNDLDLMIVVDDRPESLPEFQITLHRCLKDCYRRCAVDPMLVTREAVERGLRENSPFLRMVAREGRVLYMKNAEQDWMRQAQGELKMADYLFEGGFHKGACYHAQQAIEKGLKARLLAKGWELEKTHSIARLDAICRDYKIRLALQDEDIVFIDSIYRGRYPAEEGLLPFKDPSPDDSERALQIARGVLEADKSE